MNGRPYADGHWHATVPWRSIHHQNREKALSERADRETNPRSGTSVMVALREGLHDLFHPARTNLPALDVLRSAAILLVFTEHYLEYFEAAPAIRNFPLFRWGWTGVDLFFVLSGLLIGSQLWKELERTGRIRIGHFLLRRGLRIWPLYYGFVLLALTAWFRGVNIAEIWSDATFLSDFFPHKVAGGWSLSTEEQFYILSPILLSIFASRLAPRRLWIIPLLAVATLISVRAWIIHHTAVPVVALHQKLYFPIYTHADGLAVGLFLAWISVFHKGWLRSKTTAVIAASVMFISGLFLYRVSPMLLNFTALGLIYGSFELYGISSLPLPRILSWRGFYFVSRLSFGLYLNHFVVLSIFSPRLSEWSSRGVLHLFWAYLLCLSLSLVIAMTTFLLIEWPFLRIRARWVDADRVAISHAASMG
jgi:peptidoglycan/LPS O-acetylase OafA/YrhL